MQLEEFLSLIKISDVLLDPFYFGAGLSFAESMVIGTPTVTMPSKFMRSRVATGMYKQMKISTPPIVKSSEEYVHLAIKLAYDSETNRNLREETKVSANKYLYKNIKTLKAFEQFLEEAHLAAQLGNKLEDGYTIKIS